VRTEGDAEDRVAVRGGQLALRPTGGHVEQLDLAVHRRRPAAGGQQPAVGREGERDDAVGEVGQAVLHVAGLRVPEDDLAEAAGGGRRAGGGEGEGFDDGGVGGRRLRAGGGQRAEVGAGLRIVEVDLITAASGQDRLVGADGQRPYRLDAGRQRAE